MNDVCLRCVSASPVCLAVVVTWEHSEARLAHERGLAGGWPSQTWFAICGCMAQTP